MKLCIRAHDLGVSGSEQILGELNRLGLDGVQLVCYKASDLHRHPFRRDPGQRRSSPELAEGRRSGRRGNRGHRYTGKQAGLNP